jgi:hypothetical protein
MGETGRRSFSIMLRDKLANPWKVNAEEREQTRGHPQVVGAEPEAANAPGSGARGGSWGYSRPCSKFLLSIIGRRSQHV